MINKVELGSVKNNSKTPNRIVIKNNNMGQPNFTGLGSLALKGIQKCEEKPMAMYINIFRKEILQNAAVRWRELRKAVQV